MNRKILSILILIQSLGCLMETETSNLEEFSQEIYLYCGNHTCETFENCQSCSQDCGSCPRFSCGNEICELTETCQSCPEDCTVCVCPTNFGDCDGNLLNGCETNLLTKYDCGRCDNACNIDQCCVRLSSSSAPFCY